MTDFHGDSADAGEFSLEALDTAQSHRARSTFVIDLRRSPRVETHLPASLISERGKVTGLVTNLSRSGLRFEGGQALADLLLADIYRTAGDDELMVEASFEVPGEDRVPMPVIVQARTVYIIRNEEDVYQCGIEFRLFAQGENALVSYLHKRGVGG